MGKRSMTAVTIGVAALVSASRAENIVFPNDPSVKNVKTAFGAAGDGAADDTEALRKAFTTTEGIIYLPNGTYRVTNSIICRGRGIGPWVYGQSRDGVVIRLDDSAAGFNDPAKPQPVIAATNHLPDKGISADQFFRQWHNFTVDAGKNPGAIGVRYYGNNSSVLHNVKITGSGVYGLDLGWVDQNGPCLVRDVVVEGFRTGVYTDRFINSQTISGLTVRNSIESGILCRKQNLTIEDVTIENVPVAVEAAGVVCLVNGAFTGNDTTKPAIRNSGHLYCRNVATRGFSRAVASPEGGVAGPTVSEYSSEVLSAAFTRHREKSLGLTIRKAPPLPWEEDASKWVCVNDFGAVAGDGICDAKAFQDAIDTAAAKGKTTVCIRAGTRGDPDWYTLTSDVYVHGSVRHIIGLGFARILPSGGSKGFVLRENAAPVVKFQNLYSFGGGSRSLVTNKASTVMVEDCDGFSIQVAGRGDVFVNNCVGSMKITNPAAKVWARQWNTEGTGIDTDNSGGTLWILGLKTEKGSLKIRTTGGGRTELLGAHIYNIGTEISPRPLFEIIDASASFACVREVCYGGKEKWYTEHVRETRGGETKSWLDSDKVWALYCGADSAAVPSAPSEKKEGRPKGPAKKAGRAK